MGGRVLAEDVVMRSPITRRVEIFRAGTLPPEEVADTITNPKAWRETDATPTPTAGYSAATARLEDELAARVQEVTTLTEERDAARARIVELEAQVTGVQASLEAFKAERDALQPPAAEVDDADVPAAPAEPAGPDEDEPAGAPEPHDGDVELLLAGNPDTVRAWLADASKKRITDALGSVENAAARADLAEALLALEQGDGGRNRTTVVESLRAFGS